MTLKGYVKVSRPPLLILGFLGSLGLLSWSGTLQADLAKAVLIVVTVGLVNWSWTLWNEYCDMEVDRVNKPWKPLPSGEVTKKNVWTLAFFLFLWSISCNAVLAFNFGWIYLIGFLGHLTSFVYNIVRKDLIGNVCMAFTYGLAAFISLYPNHLLFCFAFALLTLAHNVTNQVQDVKAERTMGITTIPTQLGKMKTYYLTEILLLISLYLFSYMYSVTYYEPLLIFATATLTTMLAGLSVILEKKAYRLVENLARRLGRLLLIIGFATMLLFL